MNTLRVVSAAAGSGKTTELVRTYLSQLQAGRQPDEIIAITFTRAAGAELVERVALALRASLGDEDALRDLGDDYPLYEEYVPRSKSDAAAALRGLMNAPVGTTDSFIAGLLGEYALEARLADGTADGIPLDLNVSLGDPRAVFEAVARDVIDPPTGPEAATGSTQAQPPPEAIRLLKHLRFSTLVARVVALASAPVDRPVFDSSLFVDAVLARVADLVRQAEDPAAFVSRVNTQQTRPFLIEVKRWVAQGLGEPAPRALAQWANAITREKSAAGKSIAKQLKAIELSAAIISPTMSLFEAVRVLPRHPSWNPLPAAQIRADLLVLADRVRPIALRRCAERGELDYTLLLRAATSLCERAPDVLRRRFKALLVDEIQDANPEQMRLYQALRGLPGDGKTLDAFFVGDARQSIYLFRGAEPQLFEQLEQLANAEISGSVTPLLTNYRSTPSLVAAQRALVAAIQPSQTAESEDAFGGLPGLRDIDDVVATPNNASDELAGHLDHPEPVVIVASEADAELRAHQIRLAAVDLFAKRVQSTWSSTESGGEGRPDDTAAVLASSWDWARQACVRLRAILGPDENGRERAFVEGSRNLLAGRTAADLRVLIRALWNTSDSLAWAALWKLPPINVTDSALYRLCNAKGLIPARQFGSLASAAYADGLHEDVHEPADVAAFTAIAPALRHALASIGRRSTADVIDRFAAHTHWRAILGAGPDGADAVAQFDVLLDMIRSAESGGTDPDRVLRALKADEGDADTPKVILERGPGTVACTVVHQAKGLQWDHVCVLHAGDGGAGQSSDWAKAVVQQADAHGELRAVELVGVRCDFSGSIHPESDLQGRLAAMHEQRRRDEERLRLFYVAMTRAARSVTIAAVAKTGLSPALLDRWQKAAVAGRLPGVAFLSISEVKDPPVHLVGHAVAVRPFETTKAPQTGWHVVSPSRVEQAWSAGRREQVASHVATHGQWSGGGDVIAPPSEAWKQKTSAMGSLVHGWLAATDLAADVDVERAQKFLAQQAGWPARTDRVARWLVRISAGIAERLPAFHARVTAAGVKRHFEVPVHGAVAEGGQKSLYAGSIDLLVEYPDGGWEVVDFKGQLRVDGVGEERRDRALAKYTPQVESYRSACGAAGLNVNKVGLLFVGSVALVEW